MALENKTTLVQFGYGFDVTKSAEAGMLSFDSSRQAIYVGDGSTANLVSSGVKDATYADSVLTIIKIDGTTYTLDFSDVASAAGVSSLLGNLRKDVENNKTIIINLGATLATIDSSYQKADASINEKIGEGFDATNTVAKAINDVSTTLNDFLTGTGVVDTVDTLKDIQEWIETAGGDVTNLTQAIAAEASTRETADNNLGSRIDAVSAVASAAAVKTTTDASLDLKADKTQVSSDISTAKGEAISAAAADASSKANTAESNAKTYADKIKVNSVSQVGQDITITGLNVKVGGTGNHKDSSIDEAIEDLYDQVKAATDGGVLSFVISNDSSKYASVDNSTGAIAFTINKVAIKDATETDTGVADAYDVKTTINNTKTEIIGKEGDASTASTIYGARKLASELNEAMNTRVSNVESQLKWNVLS